MVIWRAKGEGIGENGADFLFGEKKGDVMPAIRDFNKKHGRGATAPEKVVVRSRTDLINLLLEVQGIKREEAADDDDSEFL